MDTIERKWVRQDRLDCKLDKLISMMSKLTAQGSNQNKLFKPKTYQGKRRGQTRNYYNQGNYQNKYRSNQIVDLGDYHSEVELSMDRAIVEGHNMLIIIEMTFREEIL